MELISILVGFFIFVFIVSKLIENGIADNNPIIYIVIVMLLGIIVPSMCF